MRKVLISVALASATLAALPAAAEAQPYRWDNARGAQTYFQREINQLENRIERSVDRRAISRREAGALRQQANQIERNFDRYRRNGIDRREADQLNRSLAQLNQRLRWERRDDDRRRG